MNDFDVFADPLAWTYDGESWRREIMDGVFVEIIPAGNNYQVVANRHTLSPLSDKLTFPFASINEAKERAWLIFTEARANMPNYDDLPVRQTCDL